MKTKKIKIILNGRETEIDKKTSVSGLLEQYKLNPSAVAVELSGKILKKQVYGRTFPENNSRIEIIKIMGGG